MPTYDYQCEACGHTFEEFQGIHDAILKKCPECKKNKLQRLFGTGAAIVFKGSGFYQTDYRSENYKKAAKADSKKAESASSDSAPAKAGDAKPKSESKPAKSESKPTKKD
jgi:putative FmdB family regulatory protein